MKRTIQILTLAVTSVIMFSLPALARRPVGEFTFSGGVVYPQGSYDAFSKTSPMFLVKGDLHCPGAMYLAAVSQFAIAWLKTNQPVVVEYGGMMRQGTWDETIMTCHLGVQVGSSSQKALMRFRAAALAGIYNFYYSYQFAAAIGLGAVATDTKIKFGWRFNGGVDLYFLKGMALSFDFIWDRVNRAQSNWIQDQSSGWREIRSAAHLNTYVIGLVVPFSKIWPPETKKRSGSLMP